MRPIIFALFIMIFVSACRPPTSHQVRHSQRFPEKVKDTKISGNGATASDESDERPLRSWSLFLMPDYDTYRKPELVRQFKKAFENLGRAIGRDNASEWLVTEGAEKEGRPELDYDYERAQEIIGQLGLDSATGPYIVITLTSPNHLTHGSQAFVARLTGIRRDCYPQIVDDLAEYIRKGHYDSRALYNSIEDVKEAALRWLTCPDTSIAIFKIGK